jgi:hypothetical protein
MAIVKKGNELATGQVQPGWTVQADGYGLWTGHANFKVDSGSSWNVSRGDAFPISNYNGVLFAQKVVRTNLNLDVDVVSVDYVGLSTPGSTFLSLPNVSGSNGLTSEHITTHPKFFTADGIAGPKPVGGYAPSTIVTGEFVGLNGSHFETAQGGKFMGFKDTAAPLFYGKTNYLAPVTSYSGVVYTNTLDRVTALRGALGKTSGTKSFAGVQLLPDYLGNSYVTGSPLRNQLLLAQVNHEDYGKDLYKVSYEIRFFADGYTAKVYPAAT